MRQTIHNDRAWTPVYTTAYGSGMPPHPGSLSPLKAGDHGWQASRAGLCSRWLVRCGRILRRADQKRQADYECRAFSELTFGGDGTAVQLNNRLADAQSESRAARFAGPRT